MKEVREIVDKIFKDERTIFFHQSDRHLMEEPNAYIRYQSKGDKMWFFVGSDNGEFLILTTDKAEGLEEFLQKIMRG